MKKHVFISSKTSHGRGSIMNWPSDMKQKHKLTVKWIHSIIYKFPFKPRWTNLNVDFEIIIIFKSQWKSLLILNFYSPSKITISPFHWLMFFFLSQGQLLCGIRNPFIPRTSKSKQRSSCPKARSDSCLHIWTYRLRLLDTVFTSDTTLLPKVEVEQNKYHGSIDVSAVFMYLCGTMALQFNG